MHYLPYGSVIPFNSMYFGFIRCYSVLRRNSVFLWTDIPRNTCMKFHQVLSWDCRGFVTDRWTDRGSVRQSRYYMLDFGEQVLKLTVPSLVFAAKHGIPLAFTLCVFLYTTQYVSTVLVHALDLLIATQPPFSLSNNHYKSQEVLVRDENAYA